MGFSWKINGQSISSMLGCYRKRLPAYASTISGDNHSGGLNSPQAYADFAEQCSEIGYRGFRCTDG